MVFCFVGQVYGVAVSFCEEYMECFSVGQVYRVAVSFCEEMEWFFVLLDRCMGWQCHSVKNTWNVFLLVRCIGWQCHSVKKWNGFLFCWTGVWGGSVIL